MGEMLIDVIVPVYNGAKYIPTFLDTMEKQADESVRFLFVDDGSEDETPELLQKARETRHLPMKVIQGRHAGVSAARNAGISASDAEYIAFFDIDDTCAGDFTATLRKEAEKGGFDVLVFYLQFLYGPSKQLPPPKEEESREVPKEDMLRAVLLDEPGYNANAYTLLLKRSFVEENNLRFAEGYPYYEDIVFLYWALGRANTVFRLNRWLYGYIVKHEGSAMARFSPEKTRCLELYEGLEQYFTENVPDFAPLFRQYAMARIYWSVLWQTALAAPSRKAFLRFADRTHADVFMRRMKGYPDPKVRILRRLYLVSRRLYYRTASLLGGRFTLLGRVSAETLAETARNCPVPREAQEGGQPVDLVYLYVDGSDPEWRKQRERFVKDGTDEACRIRDNGELLYSLRSVEEHAPWIRNIYIVADSAVPAWLDTENERIRVIRHREIMPPEILPCFNSNVIESYISRIPGLSEVFLYANDDMFFGNDVSPEFFVRGEKPVVRMVYRKKMPEKPKGNYEQAFCNANRLAENRYGVKFPYVPWHNIDVYAKTGMEQCRSEFAKALEQVSGNRVRTGGDIERVLFHYWLIHHGACCLEAYRTATPAGKAFYNLKVLLSPSRWFDSACWGIHDFFRIPLFRFLFRLNPRCVCLNDSESVTEEDIARYHEVMREAFPQKSSFEK